jgi:hypothetical protein
MDAFSFPAEQHRKLDLYGLGRRCLHEPASRCLDGEIYCAVHNTSDRNPLINDQLLRARENGEVLVAHGPGDVLAWIEAPPFTVELKYAEALLPEGLLTFYRDARKVCATALQARALANEPPPLVSLLSDLRAGDDGHGLWLWFLYAHGRASSVANTGHEAPIVGAFKHLGLEE